MSLEPQGAIAVHVETVADPVDRIERFQSLASGQYWRALRADPERHVGAGEVLLVQSLRFVDARVHTVILRAHPSKYGRPPDGKSWGALKEHRYLLSEFLDGFEFAPDSASVRAREVADVQERVQALQRELLQAQTDPSLLGQVVGDALAEQARAASQDGATIDGASDVSQDPSAERSTSIVARGGQVLTHLGAMTVGDAVQGGVTQETVRAMHEAAQREHQVASIKASWISSKTQEIGDTIRAMTPYYEEQAAAALAATEDVRAYVTDLMRGIASLDLYVGTGVDVQTLRKGESAAPDVPLTFVQRKLAMDEELAVWCDVDERFDFEAVETFDRAIAEHDGLVEQIFPTPRCILVMCTTRRKIDYGNDFETAAKNEWNHEAFLLVRDGLNVYRVHSPVESHLKAARLFPSKDEHEGIFKGFDGRTIKFEDVTYTDRMKEHDLFALHYKRFLILVCGLDHRLKLFGNFYANESPLNFLSMRFQEDYCRFLYDDDDSVAIAGPSAMPPRMEWVDRMNAVLRSGSRVLCNWRAVMDPTTAPGACKAGGGVGDSGFTWKVYDVEEPSVKIAFKDGSDVCVEVRVTRAAGVDSDEREFNAKVALSRHRRHHWSSRSQEMPYLVLDMVTPEDLRWYIHHRKSRADQIEYIRLFKRALRFLEAEREAQRGARDKLAAALLDARWVTDAARAHGVVEQAVLAWRAGNRGRALPAFAQEDLSPEDARAWTELLAAMFAVVEQPLSAEDVQAFAQGVGVIPLRLCVAGRGQYVLYAAALPSECDDRLEPFAWVHRIVMARGKRKLREVSRKWVRLQSEVSSERVLHVWDAGEQDRWIDAGRGCAFDSPQGKTDAFALADQWGEHAQRWTRALTVEEFDQVFRRYRLFRRELNKGARYVRNPDISVVIGVCVVPQVSAQKRKGSAQWVQVRCDAAQWLARLAPTPEHARGVRQEFIAIYRNAESAAKTFDGLIRAGDLRWQVVRSDIKQGGDVEGGFQSEDGVFGESGNAIDPLLSVHLEKLQKAMGAEQVVLGAGVGEAGALDLAFGVKRPDDWCPVDVIHVGIYGRDHSRSTKVGCVFDMVAAGSGAKDELLAGQYFGGKTGGRSSIVCHFATTAQARSYVAQASRDYAFEVAEVDVSGDDESMARWVGRAGGDSDA